MTEDGCLPDAKLVPFGSEAMESLRIALNLLEAGGEDLLPPWDRDTGERADLLRAIDTLRWITNEA